MLNKVCVNSEMEISQLGEVSGGYLGLTYSAVMR